MWFKTPPQRLETKFILTCIGQELAALLEMAVRQTVQHDGKNYTIDWILLKDPQLRSSQYLQIERLTDPSVWMIGFYFNKLRL